MSTNPCDYCPYYWYDEAEEMPMCHLPNDALDEECAKGIDMRSKFM